MLISDRPRPRIALFTGDFPLLSETFITYQALKLIDSGCDVDIFAERRMQDGTVYADPNYAPLMKSARFVSDTLLYRVGARIRRPYRLGEALKRRAIARTAFAKGREYDVILCHFGPKGLWALRQREAGNLHGPIWTIFHGYDISQLVVGPEKLDYRSLFAAGDRFLPVSDFWRQRLISLGAPPGRTVVHHMGVDIAKLPFTRRRTQPATRLFSVCRLVEKKGIEFALRALGMIRLSHPNLDWTYEIGGGGDLAESLQALAAELGIGDRVTFLGPVPHPAVLAKMAETDIFILPSVTAPSGDMEGIPVVLMEAMAMGTTAASTFHSGIPELIEHGVTGMLSPERDTESLSVNLALLMQDADLRRQLADRARAKVCESFDADKLNRRLLEMITDRSMRSLSPDLPSNHDRVPELLIDPGQAQRLTSPSPDARRHHPAD